MSYLSVSHRKMNFSPAKKTDKRKTKIHLREVRECDGDDEEIVDTLNSSAHRSMNGTFQLIKELNEESEKVSQTLFQNSIRRTKH